jgi:hypothetical protein
MSDRYFALKKPCANCPFLSEGGIELNPGRLDGIKAELLGNSFASFPCHKTTYATGGENSECGDHYHPSGKEAHCAGATAYLLANGQSNVFMRLSMSSGQIKASDYDDAIALIDTSPPEAMGEEW